jgi:hypothetical protein
MYLPSERTAEKAPPPTIGQVFLCGACRIKGKQDIVLRDYYESKILNYLQEEEEEEEEEELMLLTSNIMLIQITETK